MSNECFNGTYLKVWSVPPQHKEFAGRFIVRDTCADGQTTGTWTFTPIYSYAAKWQVIGANGGSPTILEETLKPYTNPIRPVGITQLGHVYDFNTDDPAYSCLTGTFPEADQLSVAGTTTTIVVYGTCTNSVPGAWTFAVTTGPIILEYSATWQGAQVMLTQYTVDPGPTQSTGELITLFHQRSALPVLQWDSAERREAGTSSEGRPHGLLSRLRRLCEPRDDHARIHPVEIQAVISRGARGTWFIGQV
jgi:hypothetical protein